MSLIKIFGENYLPSGDSLSVNWTSHRKILSFFILIFFGALLPAQELQPKAALLPMPQELNWHEEKLRTSRIVLNLPEMPEQDEVLQQIHQELQEKYGSYLSRSRGYAVELKLGEVAAPGHWKGQEAEAYRLQVGVQGTLLIAHTTLGLYRGIQTLKQLTSVKDGELQIATCSIVDYPAFKVRGFMHDVGRNFQSTAQLKKQIDVMAAYKYNVFHWHLTDHFGWRLESKIYPGLQSEHSYGRHSGKYYTQEEFRELLDYCKARGIVIVPELDSPGHSEAFRKGLGIENMRDSKAKQAIAALIKELCSLATPAEMPYIHIGTDEVRHAQEYVDADYLPALHAAVHQEDREVIGWWKGMVLDGDRQQIQQTWASVNPREGLRHIDSRSNYVNHLEALDFATRMYFQQPCRVPNGDAQNLGGILAYWPDILVADERKILTNNPVVPAMVAYSEAVWTGVKENRPEYWAKLPPVGSEEFEAYRNFEQRLVAQSRHIADDVYYPVLETHAMEWKLLGPVGADELPELEKGILKTHYKGEKDYSWSESLRGGAVHVKHFFGFDSHVKQFPKGKDVVWAYTYIWSERAQKVDAWINFNTISASDLRAGVAEAGHWNANKHCNIWINDERIAPFHWEQPGKIGTEVALIDEVYTSRPPAKIQLKAGWNKVLIKSAPSWKWVFSFAPLKMEQGRVKAVEGLRYSTEIPQGL